MAIPGPGLGIVRFEYRGNGVVIDGRVTFMTVAIPGLWIPDLGITGLGISGFAEIRGVRLEYSGGGAACGGVEGMAIPVLGSYSYLFTSWVAEKRRKGEEEKGWSWL